MVIVLADRKRTLSAVLPVMEPRADCTAPLAWSM